VKSIISVISSILAGLLVGLAIVILYEKGFAAVKTDLTARWAGIKTRVLAWFRTNNPETT
jgi:hypothetical protein